MGNSYQRRYLIIFMVNLFSIGNCAKANRLQFERHPEGVDYDDSYRIKVTRGHEVISSTLTQSGHYRAITVTVSAFNAVFVLDLHLNIYLFAVGYVERSFTRHGAVYHDVNHTEGHCYYLGKVRDQPQSSAAVSTCKGIVGYFTVGNVSYHIDPASNQLHGPHKVYRSRGDAKTIYGCGHESVSLDSLMNPAIHNKRLKRFIWPQDLDKKNKVVELYVANDYSQGYQPLGIYIVLVGVEVWNMGDNITINTTDPSSTLRQWANYRTTDVNPYHHNDNGILITNNTFGSVLGKAYLDQMCKSQLSAAFVSDFYSLPSVAGSIMDHEMGHNFGLIHDDEISSCWCSQPHSNCVMYSGVDPSMPSFTWSNCSLDQFATSFRNGRDNCLYNVPQTIVPSNASCGNGIVENGEQCDCGNSTEQECNKACCNPITCQLVSPATCAYGRCCNISTCQILPCGNLCRGKSDVSCDLAEFCDGSNHLCPSDTHLPDGANCTVNGVAAYCYNGQCRSHESQCELIWGPGTPVSVDRCYYYNTEGEDYANCGIKWLPNVTYDKCAASDVKCGTLQCQAFNRNLSYYLEYYSIDGFHFNDNNDACRSVIFVDIGVFPQNPGYVPSGAKCGTEKMCVNQRCLDVSSLKTTSCSSSCQPSEVCNNLGQCQNLNGNCPQSTTTSTATTTPIPTTSSPLLATSTLTPTMSTPHPTTPTATPTTSTPQPTTSTPTPTTSTPHSTTSTATPTTSAPTSTTSTAIPTTSTPTPTTSTATSITSTATPKTSTPTPTASTPTPTTSTATPTTSTATLTTSTPTSTTSTPTPNASTLTPIASTAAPTTSTATQTTSSPHPTTSTTTPTTSTPTPTTSKPNPKATAMTSTTGSATSTTVVTNPTTTSPILTESTPKTPKSTVITTMVTSIESKSIVISPNPTTSTAKSLSYTPVYTTSTQTQITSTQNPSTSTSEVTKTQTPATTLVLGLVLGALALVTAIVLPLFYCYTFCPGALTACFQLFTGAGPTAASLPLGSVTTPAFTRGAVPPVQPSRRWIPAEQFYLPQRDAFTPVRPQIEPDWSLLRRQGQPFGRGYQYPDASYPDLQPYSPRDNMKIPQIVVR